MRPFLVKRSLRLKAIGLVMLVIMVLGSIGAITSILQTHRLIASEQRHAVDSMAHSLAIACELPLTVRDQAELSHLVKRFIKDKPVLFAAVYDNKARIMASYVQNQSVWDVYRRGVREDDLFLLGRRQVELFTREDGLEVQGADGSSPSTRDAGSTSGGGKRSSEQAVGHVVVALSTEPMRIAQWSQMRVTLSSILPGILASGIIVFLAMTRWTKRLDRLVEASERIAGGDYSHAIQKDSGDEIGRLSWAYEEMRLAVWQRTDELTKANRQIRQAQADLVQGEKMGMLGQLVAGVAHEINTPTGAIMNVAADTPGHLGELALAAMKVPELPADIRQWLAETIPHVLSQQTVVSEITDRDSRRALARDLRQQGMADCQKMAEVMAACGLKASDPPAVRSLAERRVLVFLEHLTALKASSEICRASVQKIAMIVKALRYYSRSGEGEMFDININESIDNTLVILQNRIKQVARVERHYQDSLPAIRCGPDISQVWTNILSNACDAIEDAAGRRIGLLRIATLTEGEDLVVEIFNEGAPLSDDVVARIFDPFFTTKPIGKGTGLGLSICTGILSKYGGRIAARNEAGGVAFRVSLPRARRDAVHIRAAAAEPAGQAVAQSASRGDDR